MNERPFLNSRIGYENHTQIQIEFTANFVTLNFELTRRISLTIVTQQNTRELKLLEHSKLLLQLFLKRFPYPQNKKEKDLSLDLHYI